MPPKVATNLHDVHASYPRNEGRRDGGGDRGLSHRHVTITEESEGLASRKHRAI
jgi:hypothetical protein